MLILTGCATEPTTSVPDTPSTAALAESQAQLEELSRALEVCAADLNSSRTEAAELREQIAELETRVEFLEGQADARDALIRQLRNNLEAARRAEREASTKAEVLAAERVAMESEVQSLKNQTAALQAVLDGAQAYAETNTDPSLAAADIRAMQVEDVSPIIKTVFYATNRVRLAQNPASKLRPFTGPAVLLLLLAVWIFTTRRYIKERFQRRFLWAGGLVLGAAVVITFLMALQGYLLARDRAEMLEIQYGNELRDNADGAPYERGSVKVSIPPHRAVGEVPTPDLIRFEFVVDPTQHFQLQIVEPADKVEFYRDLQTVLAEDATRSAFVFVHGFHNTFEDAAFRTAQIAHDLQFPGAPVFFSWPSQGAVLDYLTDATNVETTKQDLRQFLKELHTQSGAERIHLIAHSMGSRALSEAVERLVGDVVQPNRFGELVFAAPDIARSRLEQMIPALTTVTQGVTLYASAHDSALRLSRALQGNEASNYQRAGETYPQPMIVPPMQTIDVSFATRGHSYISNSPAVLRDLDALFSGAGADRTWLQKAEGLEYWKLLELQP